MEEVNLPVQIFQEKICISESQYEFATLNNSQKIYFDNYSNDLPLSKDELLNLVILDKNENCLASYKLIEKVVEKKKEKTEEDDENKEEKENPKKKSLKPKKEQETKEEDV